MSTHKHEESFADQLSRMRRMSEGNDTEGGGRRRKTLMNVDHSEQDFILGFNAGWDATVGAGTEGQPVSLSCRAYAVQRWKAYTLPSPPDTLDLSDSDNDCEALKAVLESRLTLLAALTDAHNYLDSSLSPCEPGCDCIIHLVEAAIAKAIDQPVSQ